MVKELVHDPFMLGMSSEAATADDAGVARDLSDTLEAHKKGCVGMAANMIGVRKRIIAFYDGNKLSVMFNPERGTPPGDAVQKHKGALSG